MKFLSGHLVFSFALAFQPFITAEELPQSQRIDLVDDKVYLRLNSVPGRTYFLQSSKPGAELKEWLWMPEMRAGNGNETSFEMNRTAGLRFFRLAYTDQPIPAGETAETADFDHDNLSNIEEIRPTMGLPTHPMNADTDADGLNDGWEKAHGIDANDDGSINAQNGANGFFQGGSTTNEQAFALGVSTHPNATLVDLDGDNILNELDAEPRELLIDWPRSRAFSSYVVIDLNMEPLGGFFPPRGRLPVYAVLNDHGAVCRAALWTDEDFASETPAVWDGTSFPVQWSEVPDYLDAGDMPVSFDEWEVSFNNAGNIFHGLDLNDGSDNSPGIRNVTIKWDDKTALPGKYGTYEADTDRIVHARFDHLAVETQNNQGTTVSTTGFSISGNDDNKPYLSRFNTFSSYAPSVTRTGKIMISQNGQLKVNDILVPPNSGYGLTADPHGNDLIVTSTFGSAATLRHRKGVWEKMPMPGIVDMNADGVGITFPEQQIWANGSTIQLDDLLSESGWSEFMAEQINARGVILGSAKPVDGTNHKAVVMVPLGIVAHKRGTIDAPGMEQPAGNGEYGYETVVMENADSEDNADGERDCDTEAVDKDKDDDLVKIVLHYPGPKIKGASLALRHVGMAVDAKVRASAMNDPTDAIEILATGSRINFYDKNGNKLNHATDLSIADMANPGSSYLAGILDPANDGKLTLFIEGGDQFGLVGPPLEPVKYGYEDSTIPDAKAAAKKLGGAFLTLALKMGEQKAEASLLVYRGGFLSFKQPKNLPGTRGYLEFWDGKGRIRHQYGGHENEFKEDVTDWGTKLKSWSAKSGKTSGADYNIAEKNGHIPPGWWINYERTHLEDHQQDEVAGAGVSKTITQGSYCRWEQDDAADSGRYDKDYKYAASKPNDAVIGEPTSISFKFELVPLPPSSGQNRTAIQLHPDGGKNGTAGCIGIQKYTDCLEVRYVMSSFSNLKIKVESK